MRTEAETGGVRLGAQGRPEGGGRRRLQRLDGPSPRASEGARPATPTSQAPGTVKDSVFVVLSPQLSAKLLITAALGNKYTHLKLLL